MTEFRNFPYPFPAASDSPGKEPMRLFKRGKSYYIEFTKYEKRSLRTGNREEAEQLFRAARKEYLRGRISKPETGTISLKDYYQKFRDAKPGIAQTTADKYDLSVKLLAQITGWNAPIRDLDKNALNRFKSECLDRGCRPVTVNSYLRHIRTVLNMAHEDGVMERHIRIRMIPEGKRLPKILSKSEREKICGYALSHDPEMFRIIIFALNTGARRSEIRNLAWEDTGADHIRIIGKGNRERIIPLIPAAKEAMGEPAESGPVFMQCHPDGYTHRIQDIYRACGISGRNFHSLRHSAATAMLESGIPVAVIQKILGHADIKTTLIYADVVDSLVAEEMRKLRF